jgi:signal transduction histidine kinase
MAEAAPATILVVDDDRGLLRLVERALQREGFNTAAATSGKEAIAWLEQNTAALMLLDLKLQDIEGRELIGALADAGRVVPFIVITGQGDERVAVEMMKRGALDYLVKDVQFVEFVPTVVRRALEKLETARQLTATRAALEESQKQILSISEREQRRFGAELHDGLGQQLTAIELQCQSLKEDLPANRLDLQKQVAQIGQHLREAIAQTRSLAHGLSPVNLGSGGLAEALSELALRMSREGKIKCVFESSAPVEISDHSVAEHFFRIAQEAVNNAVKHSGADRIVIRMSNTNHGVQLEIADNGRGLPKSERPQRGIGLQVMKHRASLSNAQFEIRSRRDKGVTVTCTLKKTT